MAQIKTTLTITIDEANLILRLLEEGEETRQALGKEFSKSLTREVKEELNADQIREARDAYQRVGQEVLLIQAMRRGLRGLSS